MSEIPSRKNSPYRIAIVYLAIGEYDVLWDEFYQSCEEYLFPDAGKQYFVFTDSKRFLAMNLPNVSCFFWKDNGWAMNALSKYDCMLSVREQLGVFDFLFYINANYKVLEPIRCNEILATADNGYLSVLSFDFLGDRHPDTFTYDRNPLCQAYIPYGKGTHYYQASFYGGRVSEMLALATWCATSTRIDLSNGLMALWHDESYLNKYLLGCHPKVISMTYCKLEEFDGASKAILRDKNKILGKTNVDRLKQVFTNPFLSYLRDKELQIKPFHWIERMERLGNQMFQYAFLLGLQSSFPESRFCLSSPVALPNAPDDSNNLEKVFDIPVHHLADEGLARQIRNTPDCDIRKIDALGLYPERTRRLLQKETCVINCLPEIENRAVTFVIPLRVDSSERSANLDAVLQQLSHKKQTSILILEADTESRYVLKQAYPNVKYLFVEDSDTVFHRTKYLNRLLREADTELVGIWDTDVVLSDIQIDRALQDICEGKAVMSYPYDGRFYFCSAEESTIYRQGYLSELGLKQANSDSYCITNSVGGAFLVRKTLYLEAGGENEAFYGWGLEDKERIRRLFILGLPVTRVEGPLFHLYHPRNENSRYRDEEAENRSRLEFLKVCGMSSEDLKRNIDVKINLCKRYESDKRVK